MHALIIEVLYSTYQILRKKQKKTVELVFVKHYASNICLSLNMAKFAQCRKSTKTFWTLLKRVTGNLLIIPYRLTKFQTPSSNLLTRLKCPLQRDITQEKIDKICLKVNQIICLSYSGHNYFTSKTLNLGEKCMFEKHHQISIKWL